MTEISEKAQVLVDQASEFGHWTCEDDARLKAYCESFDCEDFVGKLAEVLDTVSAGMAMCHCSQPTMQTVLDIMVEGGWLAYAAIRSRQEGGE